MAGASATCIRDHLGGGDADGSYPHDAGDFGRCEAMLASSSDLAAKFEQMADLNAYWRALVPRWPEIVAAAPEARSEIIASIVGPIEAIDPECGRMGSALVRIGGKVTFQGEGAPKKKGRTPMKDDPDFRKHNQHAYSVTADELRQFIEQWEHLEAEKKDIAAQQKDIMSEAKSRGYDTKGIRKVIALRKRDKDDIAEEEAILELYKTALGMG